MQIHPDGSKDTLAAGFGPSAGLAIGDVNEYYVTNLFFGTVLKLSQTSTSSHRASKNARPVLSITQSGTDYFTLAWDQPVGGEVTMKVAGLDGKIISNQKLGYFPAGDQTSVVDGHTLGLHNIPMQNLAVALISEKMFYSTTIILNK